jgi:hypothetical protein
MMAKLKVLLFRLPLALLLAVLIVPIGNLLSPDTLLAGRTQVPAAVDAAVQEHLGQLAKQYGIDAPIHRFTSMRFAAVTSRSALPEDAGKVVIGLGQPVQKQNYFDHPEWLKSVAGHEFGHALMMARGQAFSELPIFAMYALAFVPILLIFPSRRDRILAAAALALGIAGFMTLQPGGIVNDAFLSLMFDIAVGVLLIRFAFATPGKTRIEALLRAHLPSNNEMLIATVAGAMLFAIAYVSVGGANSIYELRGDVVGACSTSAQSMKDGLLHLSNNPEKMNNAGDTFHPGIDQRIQLLNEMEKPEIYYQACKALLDGKTPITIAGHQIQ